MLKSDQSKRCIRGRSHGYAKFACVILHMLRMHGVKLAKVRILSDFLQSILIIQ